jgi:hypothetical protein
MAGSDALIAPRQKQTGRSGWGKRQKRGTACHQAVDDDLGRDRRN